MNICMTRWKKKGKPIWSAEPPSQTASHPPCSRPNKATETENVQNGQLSSSHSTIYLPPRKRQLGIFTIGAGIMNHVRSWKLNSQKNNWRSPPPIVWEKKVMWMRSFIRGLLWLLGREREEKGAEEEIDFLWWVQRWVLGVLVCGKSWAFGKWRSGKDNGGKRCGGGRWKWHSEVVEFLYSLLNSQIVLGSLDSQRLHSE